MTAKNLSIVMLLIALITAPGQAQSRQKDWQIVRTQGMMKLVLVTKSKERDRSVYQDAIKSLCTPGGYCYILFWSSRASVPKRIPMSDAQAQAQVASYTHNPTTNFDEFLMTCRIEKNPNKCF
jgi:phosphatidate phosphatase APP1